MQSASPARLQWTVSLRLLLPSSHRLQSRSGACQLSVPDIWPPLEGLLQTAWMTMAANDSYTISALLIGTLSMLSKTFFKNFYNLDNK